MKLKLDNLYHYLLSGRLRLPFTAFLNFMYSTIPPYVAVTVDRTCVTFSLARNHLKNAPIVLHFFPSIPLIVLLQSPTSVLLVSLVDAQRPLLTLSLDTFSSFSLSFCYIEQKNGFGTHAHYPKLGVCITFVDLLVSTHMRVLRVRSSTSLVYST